MKEILLEMLRKRISPARIMTDVPMSGFTTMRVGGNADVLVRVKETEELRSALLCAREAGAPCLVIGNGSNLLVRDGGIRGLVACTTEMSGYTIEKDGVTALSGQSLMTMAQATAKAGLAGLEFAAGIPGSVGGAVAMNAGAYGGEISQTLVSAQVLDENLQPREVRPADGDMGYRTSIFGQKGWIVTAAAFALSQDEGASRRMRDWLRQRREKQPLQYPSAGSVFKRPEGHFAGALIEAAGLKGERVGDAQVSELHAGFIINTGGATAADVLALIGRVRERVYAHSGVKLELELKIVGADSISV